ncbi:palindromic element RPE2 domain-containing protein [Candidatus Tisiphia endosymbiont of Mystacides longicornis]|uniref:palindromic element RPE2 domain-containing protein n=1 Tax=Candidatus Tisiphia endosymbiont of Mystacides longicornis TaxID=3139330 RepID=UPI003CCAAF12
MFVLDSLLIVNSGEFGARSDGATPISNRRALSDNVTNFSSIDYITFHPKLNLILGCNSKRYLLFNCDF